MSKKSSDKLEIMVNKEIVRLEVLAIELELPERCRYHDDGFVKSISQHTIKLNEIYGLVNERVPETDALGRSLTRIIEEKEGLINHRHIFYLDVGEILNSYVRGHEETHALEAWGMLSLLEEQLVKIGVNLKLYEIANGETRASIGGVYSFLRNGREISQLLGIYTNPQLLEAIKILRKNK